MIKLPEFVWLVGGAAITVLFVVAVLYWIIQESLARGQSRGSSPPPPAQQEDAGDSGTDSCG